MTGDGNAVPSCQTFGRAGFQQREHLLQVHLAIGISVYRPIHCPENGLGRILSGDGLKGGLELLRRQRAIAVEVVLREKRLSRDAPLAKDFLQILDCYRLDGPPGAFHHGPGKGPTAMRIFPADSDSSVTQAYRKGGLQT